MKAPNILALSLSVFALTASIALAGGPGQAQPAPEQEEEVREPQGTGFRDSLRRAGHRLTHTDRSEPGEEHHVRDTIRETVQEGAYRLTHTDHDEPGEDHHVRDSIRNFVHKLKLHRPRAFHYLEMRKSKEGVKVYACEPMIERVANAQECRQLHRGSLNPKSLYGCLGRREESRYARRLQSNLDKLMRRPFDIRRVDDSIPNVEAYTDVLLSCSAAAPAAKPAKKPARPVAPRPAEDAPQANPEFKPVPVDAVPPSGEASDTL